MPCSRSASPSRRPRAALAPPFADANRMVYVIVGVVSLVLAIVLVTVGPRVVCIQLAMAVVLYGAVLVLNAQLVRLWYGLAVLFIDVAVTLVVANLVLHLRAQALHDPLTGAYNRHGLEGGATLVHHMDSRTRHATTVVEIDLDGFEQYDDAHGHAAGDEVLARVVQAWRGVLRRTDILARTGGDEFVLILHSTGLVEAEALVARMREVTDVPWTAGPAEWQQGEPLPEVLRHADEAMYRAKTKARVPRPRPLP